MNVYVLHWTGGYGLGGRVIVGVYDRFERASEAMTGFTAEQQRWLMVSEFRVQGKR